MMHFGILKLDPVKKAVFVSGQPVKLTRMEKTYLFFLAENAGKILSQEAILAGLYARKDMPEKKIVDVIICKFRKKLALASPPGSVFVETVWGHGYRLNKTAKANA